MTLLPPTSPLNPGAPAPAAPSPAAPLDLAAAIKAGGPGQHSKWVVIAVLVVVALSVGGWFRWRKVEAAKNQAPPYTTEALQRGDITLTITATGTLVPTNEVTVGSELSGTTLEVYVDINDRVTKGQPLAKLDTGKLTQQTAGSRAAVKAAQAAVTLAAATVKESEATLARQQELQRLSGGKVPSKLDLDSALAAAERARANQLSAEAAVGQAQAQVLINESDLAKAIVKSPIDGIVLTRSIEPGQTVAASFTAPQLFVIAEKLERMKLEVAIAEADIGRVAKGQKSTFTVDAWPDRAYTASVIVVSYGSAVTNNVVTYEADLEVSNDDLSLRPGMTATADILVAESKNVFLVPTAALRFVPATTTGVAVPVVKKSFVQSLIPTIGRKGGARKDFSPKPAVADAHVWILRDGQPAAISVRLGLSDGRDTEISGEGLTEGLAIILRANAPSP
jgi:HlyD family secretion protein